MTTPQDFAPFNLGQLMTEGLQRRAAQEQLQAAQDERQQRQTLGELLPGAVQGDAKALAGVAMASPSTYVTLQGNQAAHADDHAQLFGQLATAVRRIPYEGRRAYIQQLSPQLQRMGFHPDEIQTFDPTDQNLDAMTTLGTSRRQTDGPNIQREVDYYRSIGRNDEADQLLSNHAAGAPVLFDVTGDGVPDLVPRSYFNQGGQRPPAQQPQTATNPQTGERVRLNPATGQWEPMQGGAGQPQAPGTFPRQDGGAFDFQAHP